MKTNPVPAHIDSPVVEETFYVGKLIVDLFVNLMGWGIAILFLGAVPFIGPIFLCMAPFVIIAVPIGVICTYRADLAARKIQRTAAAQPKPEPKPEPAKPHVPDPYAYPNWMRSRDDDEDLR